MLSVTLTQWLRFDLLWSDAVVPLTSPHNLILNHCANVFLFLYSEFVSTLFIPSFVLADRSIFVPLTVNHGKFPKQEDSYAFEEDSSSESLSPEQNHSDESQGSACPSSDAVASTASSSSSPALTSPQQVGPNALAFFSVSPLTSYWYLSQLCFCCPPVVVEWNPLL